MLTSIRTVWVIIAGLLLLLAISLVPRHDTAPRDTRPLDSVHSGSVASAGHPDLFARWHASVRVPEDGHPYPIGYRVAEFAHAVRALKQAGKRLDWTERGPGNVGGRTRAIAVDPSDPTEETWYAGTVGGGLWKTVDGGERWTSLTDHLPNLSVSSLAIVPSDPRVLYMGTGEGFGNLDAIAGAGIFRSDDSGQTWTHLAATAVNEDFRFVNRLAVDPDNADVILAATNTGIFRSGDSGESWVQAYAAADRVQDLRAQPGNFNVLLAAENGTAILRSDDRGKTWTPALDAFPNGCSRIEIAFSPSDSAVVWAAIQIDASSSDLVKSTDGGQTWTWTLPTAPNWLGAQGWYDNTLAVHPFAADTVFLGGINLWRGTLHADSGNVAGPSKADWGLTPSFMEFVSFDSGTHFGQRLALGINVGAHDVVEAHYGPIEIRFGQGLQKAHRFIVSPTGGLAGDGGAGIPLSEYEYAGYVDVPLQVWDTQKNQQLMFSFRDQADNGEWDLIPLSYAAGTPRNLQSREYIFVHRYQYDALAPQAAIAADGGVSYGLLYWMWPYLADSAAWDPNSLPSTQLSISYARVRGVRKTVRSHGRGAHVDHHALIPIHVNAVDRTFSMLNANDGGVAISRNGGRDYASTDQAGAGFNTAQFYGIAKRPGANVYIGGMQDNGTWKSREDASAEDAWDYELSGDGFEALWHSTNEQLVLASQQFNYLRRSTNGGSSWLSATNGLQDVGVNNGGQFMTQLAHSPHAPDRVFTIGRSGVWRSENFGVSWTLAPVTSHWGFGDSGKVRASLASEDVVWAGYAMDDNPSTTLHVSRNRGVSFLKTTIADESPNARLSGLATHPHEAGTAFALFSARSRPKVLRTTNYGQHWTDLSGFGTVGSDASTSGFPNVAIYDLLVMPHAPNVLWVGTEIGLFHSLDAGTTWSYADNGLPAVAVWRMKVRDNQIVVATHGRGVWTAPLASVETAVDDTPSVVPAEVVLEQNYPNPFNAHTTIGFAVPETMHIKIAVYDATGRRIATLADQLYTPGRHALHWLPEGMASGVYYYRLGSGGRLIQTQVMTLVK